MPFFLCQMNTSSTEITANQLCVASWDGTANVIATSVRYVRTEELHALFPLLNYGETDEFLH